MNGYRTIIVGLISVFGGLMTAMGYGIPEETLQSLTESLTALVGAGMTVYGVVMMVMRVVTKTPLGESVPKQDEKDPHDPTA